MRSIVLAVQLAFRNLQANTVRTFVTLIGIVISIAAIIIVVSAGDSVKEYVLSEVGSFGSDVIQVEVRVPSGAPGQNRSTDAIAGIGSITTMTIKDAERIAKLENVETYYASIIGQGLAQYKAERKQAMIWGATPDVTVVDPQVKIDKGVFYTGGDEKGAERKVVLGSDIKETLFGNRDAVGRSVNIKGQNYIVSGVLEERGSSFGFSFDEMMYMPVRTLQQNILGVDHVAAITVKVKDDPSTSSGQAKMEETVEQIKHILRDRHDIDDPDYDDFEVMSIQEAQDLVAEVFGAVNILLLAVASISLLVGGVGIMNVMFVSLEERTTEIGLRKALGARNGDILKQFLLESVVIALIGGAMGMILGTALLTLGIRIAGNFGFALSTGLSIETILIAVFFSVGTGILFGVYPARRAAQVPPVVAMRQE